MTSPRVTATIFKPSLGAINVSVSLSESYSHQATISEHPVESGSTISDHVQTTGVAISMEGIITDVTSSDEEEADDTIELGYARLVELFESRSTFEVVTGLGGLKKDMLFKSLTVKRDKDNVFALAFTADLQQIRFADAATVLVAAVKSKSGKTKSLGHKPTETAPASATQSSRSELDILLHGAIDGPIP